MESWVEKMGQLPPEHGAALSVERLREREGAVLEPVPEDQRTKYRFWRGVHLGRVAVNVSRGYRVIAAGTDVHWMDDYLYAKNVATELVRSGSAARLQFAEEDERVLSEKFPLLQDFDFPVIVVALDEQYNDGLGLLPSTSGERHGYVSLAASFESLDPYSQQTLERLFGSPRPDALGTGS